MFLPDDNPLVLLFGSAALLVALVAMYRDRRRRRRDLRTYIEQRAYEPKAPQTFAALSAPFAGGGAADPMPAMFKRRMVASKRRMHAAQGGMMIVIGLSMPLIYSLVHNALGLASEPPLFWLTAFVMAGFIGIGILGIFSRGR